MRLIVPLVFALCACGQDEDVRDVRTVSVHRTPGKPMAFFDPKRPAEEIRAQREPEGYGLVVSVNVPRAGAKKLQEHRAILTDAEWKGLLKVVSGNGLMDWNPEPRAGAVADWGEAGFTIAASKRHAPRWIKPLENSGPADALFKALAELARKKLPDVKLYYLK